MLNCIRLNFIVEGTTEEIFVRDVLREFFAEKNIFVSARRVETSRKQLRNVNYYRPGKQVRVYRGGVPSFEKVARDINRWLNEDPGAYLIARQIGIDIMRNECKHFNDWVVNLIGLTLYK